MVVCGQAPTAGDINMLSTRTCSSRARRSRGLLHALIAFKAPQRRLRKTSRLRLPQPIRGHTKGGQVSRAWPPLTTGNERLSDNAFPLVPKREAAARRRAHGQSKFLIPGLISRAGTILYGQPKAGKTVLTSQLVYSLATGAPFLDVTPESGPLRVGVALTDGGALEEFDDLYQVFDPTFSNLWEIPDIRDEGNRQAVISNTDVLVIDNLDGLLPDDADMNNRNGVRPTMGMLTQMIRQGIPVILVHHANKPGMSGAGKAMNGSTFITSWPRMILRLEKNRQGAGTHKLTVSGNHVAEQACRLHLDDSEGLRFRIANPWDSPDQEKAERRQKRDGATMDINLKHARFVVEHCQGMTQRKAAMELAAKFGGSHETYRSRLKGAIPVEQAGAGAWVLTEAAQNMAA
ncbi:AAA family ATPase [Streptosporangium sp. CA-135522]|uniref:AAA family ATPase n=1 Tax=Streptosporangium sp. CA-135522 TaxID=3240072 RepID=UPI003D8D3C31